MKPTYKKILNLALIIAFVWHLYYLWNTSRDLSFEQAGTDLSQSYNSERKKMDLAIIPENWANLYPLENKVQIWENPENESPSYSEKIVIATTRSELEQEYDIYNLKKIENKFHQLRIWFCKPSNNWRYSWHEVYPNPDDIFKYDFLKRVSLTKEQAIDTLNKYGLKRLNY